MKLNSEVTKGRFHTFFLLRSIMLMQTSSEEQLEKYPTMVLDKSFNILEANSLCRSLMKVEHGNELKDIKLSSLVTYVEQHRLETFLKEASNTMLNKETREIFVKCLLCDAVGQQLVMKIRLMRRLVYISQI